jgi:hypothetical protein
MRPSLSSLLWADLDPTSRVNHTSAYDENNKAAHFFNGAGCVDLTKRRLSFCSSSSLMREEVAASRQIQLRVGHQLQEELLTVSEKNPAASKPDMTSLSAGHDVFVTC